MAANECTDFYKHCRKIIGVANNFKGKDPDTYPKEPILFTKVPTTLVTEGNPIKIPEGYGTVTYEVELGVIIGKEGSNIAEHEVLDHIGGYCLTLDMTALDAGGIFVKNWDTFTPVSDFIPKESIPNMEDVNLWLTLDDVLKQSGNTKDLYFGIKKVVSYASKIMKLEKGDLFLTGTPLGNGLCKSGEVIKCGIKYGDIDVKNMSFTVQ